MRTAVAHLRSGGLLVYPTETVYAIGCDATNARAVRALFRVKHRSRGKPLPMIVASSVMAARYATMTPLARMLAHRFWPGPCTMVLSGSRAQQGARGRCASEVYARDGSLAVRVSSSTLAHTITRSLGRPIVSTSANRSGAPSCFSARAALRSLGHVPRGVNLMVLDIGVLPRRVPSTIVDARGRTPIVLRRGAVLL